jgi:hypothetical protein
MILNLINNKIINQKIYGESYIQVASTGFEGRRFSKPTAEQLEIYGANELQFYRIDPVTGKTLPMEVKVGFDSNKHGGLLNLTYKEKKVGDLKTLNDILKSDSPLAVMWREKHQELLTMVGVRIPVQGFSQIEHAVVKEFLPESVGAIMVLPAQIVIKSGGDYDIDKLTFFETAYDSDGNVIDKSFDLADYKVKLEEQRELKKQKQRLLSILKVIKEEITDNEAYARRKELKSEIAQLEADVKKSIASLNGLLSREEVTAEDKKAGLDDIFDKKDPLARVVADLKALNQSSDFTALSFMSQVREDLKAVNKKISEVEDYKKSITNNLVSTLKEILSIGELYDYLVAPNNNNVLTDPKVLTNKGKKITTTDIFNPLTSWRIYAENILSKDALGIDAKINTMQKEFQLANLKYSSPLLNNYYLKANKDKDGNIMLGGKRGQDGNRISKILSEFVNGHVDIAKEDWIILLGMNQETSPLAHAMILAGTPIKDIIDFIKSKPIQLVLELGNRPVIDQKINNSYFSKNSAIVNLLMNSAEALTDLELKESIQKVAASNKENGIKGKNSVANYIELLLSNPKVNKYLTEFNPNLEATGANENALKNIAYLLQFGVVIAQQEKLRELTSLADFNTSNYRTTFQSVELLEKEGGLKEAFNAEAINFMFKKSALANFNVGSFTLDIMNKIFPLSDSNEVHIQIDKFLQYQNLVNEEERRNAINQYKDNLLYTYVALTAKKDDNTSLLNYYRGKDGMFTKGTPNNIAERFQELSSNAELRGNFVFNNLYIDDDGIASSKEIVFSLRNTEFVEYGKEYRQSFLEGLNHADEKIRNFFKDLAMGSYLQNGSHYKSQELSSVIPFEAYVDYTKDAFTKLTEMKDTNPALFSNYLTLVGFATVLTRNHTGPLLALPSFLTENYKETIDYMISLDSTLVAKIAKYEEALRTGVPIIPKPSTSVDEFNLADKLTPIAQNFADGQGGQMQPQFKGKSTMDLIISGDRTRTTRANTDIQRMSKDYGLSKISDLVGKVVRMTDKTGRQVYTRITKVTPFTQEYQDATWQKEGWVKSVTDKNVGNYPYAIEFEVVSKPTTQPSTKASDQNNMNEFVNHSGGALGADTAWDTIGKEFGMINNQHYWMNNKTPKGNVEITNEDSVEGQQKVTSAARNMGRIEPNQQVRDERLIRNWSQVKYSDAVFAVTTMLSVGGEMNYGKVAKIRQGKGGTGYAIQMAIEAGKPVYVFDQTRKQWFKNINGTWSTSDVPTLTKNFAGIGTREINEAGKQAIRDTYAATVSALTTAQTNLDEQMYSPNEGTITPITSKIVTLPITDKGPSNIDNKLNDQLGGKNNLDDLGFEEVSCDIPE